MNSFKRVVRSLAIIAALSSVAGPLFAQVNDTYVLSAAINARGSGNTRWATEFSIFNPQSYKLNVALVYIPTGVAAAKEIVFPVNANETVVSDNVLADAFGIEGSGSLLVATFPEDNPGVPNNVLDRSFLVRARIFEWSGFGTYGQSVPGVWSGLLDYKSDGISAIAHGIRNRGTSGISGFRTNIGAVNLGRTSVTMRVTVYDSAGKTLAKNLPFIVPPQGHMQDRLPVEVTTGSVEFFVDDPTLDAVVFPYASIVDNRSQDAVFVAPTLLASPSILFKGAMSAMAASESPGKKITIDDARALRDAAIRLGTIVPVRDADGVMRLPESR